MFAVAMAPAGGWVVLQSLAAANERAGEPVDSPSHEDTAQQGGGGRAPPDNRRTRPAAGGHRDDHRAADLRRTGADKTRRDYDRDCLRSGCHASLSERPWVHAPVAVGACGTCHEPRRGREHEFSLARTRSSLCSTCHRSTVPRRFSHAPYASGNCEACHDPHGGTRLTTRESGGPELCVPCHTAGSEPAHAHPPFAEGKCLACHDAHESDHAGLLARSERELCLTCHDRVRDELESSAHAHQPVVEGCRSCHLAHGGPRQLLLRAAPDDLCSTCHESVSSDGTPRGHGPDEASCASCHRGHAGASQTLVQSPLGEVCLACHDREVPRPGGRNVIDVKARVSDSPSAHRPATEGSCSSCHTYHDASDPRLLENAYPSGHYARYTRSSYDLCFACHDPRLVEEEGRSWTRFRDGERNLHRVHVQSEKGRSCGICHDPHAGGPAASMRRSVPFGTGAWTLPIGFERTARGGTCRSGCHQPMSYVNRGAIGIDETEADEADTGGR